MPCLLDCLIVGVSNTDKCCKRKKIFYDDHRLFTGEKDLRKMKLYQWKHKEC